MKSTHHYYDFYLYDKALGPWADLQWTGLWDGSQSWWKVMIVTLIISTQFCSIYYYYYRRERGGKGVHILGIGRERENFPVFDHGRPRKVSGSGRGFFRPFFSFFPGGPKRKKGRAPSSGSWFGANLPYYDNGQYLGVINWSSNSSNSYLLPICLLLQ